MHLFLLLVHMSHAGRAPFCKQDLSEFLIPWLENELRPPKILVERALRPALLHFQEDLCRCLPRRRHQQPSTVWARLHVDPPQGELVLKYELIAPEGPARTRMAACMGEPTLSFEPVHYASDIITPDGPKHDFTYPLVVELWDEQDQERRRPRD